MGSRRERLREATLSRGFGERSDLRPKRTSTGEFHPNRAESPPDSRGSIIMSGPSFPPGVDWDFIAAREGAMLNGYVPRDASGNPDAHSGVTIAVGFDLGGRTVASLQALGLDPTLVVLLTPYLGLRGTAAQNYVHANPLTIT